MDDGIASIYNPFPRSPLITRDEINMKNKDIKFNITVPELWFWRIGRKQIWEREARKEWHEREENYGIGIGYKKGVIDTKQELIKKIEEMKEKMPQIEKGDNEIFISQNEAYRIALNDIINLINKE